MQPLLNEKLKSGFKIGNTMKEAVDRAIRRLDASQTTELSPGQSFDPRDSHGQITEKEIDKILSEAYSEWRNESIKGYGNAVVPQVVLQIFKSIEDYVNSKLMIQIVKLKNGKYFNRVKAPNGATLMKSEHFKSLQAAKKNIESLRLQIWLEPKMVTQ